MGEIPILQIGPLLLVTIQTELHDRLAEQLQEDILQRVRETEAEGVLIDITALEMVDSLISRGLSETAQMVKVMGARMVLVGLQPEVTMALLELGLKLTGIETQLDIDSGIRRLGYHLAAVDEEVPGLPGAGERGHGTG